MAKEDERVLVVGRSRIFPDATWNGIKNSLESERVLQLASREGEFKRRGDVEGDPSLKQIIPYVVFKHEDKYLLMQRLASHDEQRLANMYSCGIGGHINDEDLKTGETVFDWSKREFAEEVEYKGNLDLKVLGVLNDDSNPVGEVHLGVIIVAEGDSSEIQVKDEHKSGKLVTLDEAMVHLDSMENWSRIVFEYLAESSTK